MIQIVINLLFILIFFTLALKAYFHGLAIDKIHSKINKLQDRIFKLELMLFDVNITLCDSEKIDLPPRG